MTEEKPYICPPPEADGNYKYYIVGSNIPVRIKYDENGHRCLGESPDREDPRKLRVNNPMISKIRKDEDVEEITKEAFIQAYKDFVADEMLERERKNLKKKTNRPGGLNM